jgi:hypothetical protein
VSAQALMVAPAAGFPPDTILTKAQLAVALSTSEDSIERAGSRRATPLGAAVPATSGKTWWSGFSREEMRHDRLASDRPAIPGHRPLARPQRHDETAGA